MHLSITVFKTYIFQLGIDFLQKTFYSKSVWKWLFENYYYIFFSYSMHAMHRTIIDNCIIYVDSYLDANLGQRWIGCKISADMSRDLFSKKSRSDIFQIFLMGVCQSQGFSCFFFSVNLNELKQCISAVVAGEDEEGFYYNYCIGRRFGWWNG